LTLFDWLKQQVSIIDVVGQYVRLVRLGNYFKASCMFHSETDASFTVSPDKGIFYCFGCHATGDVISFIAKIEHLTQAEAVKLIIDRMGLVVPDALKNAFTQHDEVAKKDYFAVCSFFEAWSVAQLAKSSVAQGYLRKRGVSDDLVAQFNLGYIPGGQDSVQQLIRAAHTKGLLLKHFIDAGLLVQSSTTVCHSPFEERIMFPIYDPSGRCVGFGGRIFKDGDVRPKYYNSRESDFFLKRQLLFGYHKAKNFFIKTERAFIVEGYLDAIMLFGSGVQEVVATLGTACTQDHLKLLSRFVRKVYVVYDGDKAGQKATLRLAEQCWDVNLELFVISLPQGQDPASFVQAGGDALHLVESAQDIFTFFIKSVALDFTKKTLSEKMEIGQRIASVIARISNRFKQDLLVHQAAKALQVQELSMRELVAKTKNIDAPEPFHVRAESSPVEVKPGSKEGAAEKSLRDVQEKIVGALLCDYKNNNLLELLDPRVVGFLDDDIQGVFQKIKAFTVNSPDLFTAFLETLDQETKLWVMKASLSFEGAVTRSEFQGLVINFCRSKWRLIIARVKTDASAVAEYQLMKEIMGVAPAKGG
jgi:DNA primase